MMHLTTSENMEKNNTNTLNVHMWEDLQKSTGLKEKREKKK